MIMTIMKKYEKPAMQVVELKLKGIICYSPDVDFDETADED